jgi:hypothetical protein
MDYGSDLLLARGSREGGPETCRSHRRAARRPKGGQWSLRISRRRLTLRGYVKETHAARLRERAWASILCGIDCKRCSQRCRLRPLIC